MNIALIVAMALGFAAVLGCARALRDGGHNRIERIALQLAAAGLLYLCLFPPTVRESFSADELTVLTPGATAQQIDALSSAASVVALPGVNASYGVERAPDLGTALRRHPHSRQLRITGGGLPARDRDAARGIAIQFDAAPLPRGLVELDAPTSVRAGNVWRLRGRAEGVAGGQVELRDPAGARVASSGLDKEGRFALSAPAKGAGEVVFTLRARAADGASIDEDPVPLSVRAGEPLRVLLLAGAPDPELKYLRRWAIDAGMRVDSRLTLSEGVALTEGGAALDPATLHAADIAIIDERAWAGLDAVQKNAIGAAVRDGLGLLLRVTGPVPAPVAAEWAALGFSVRASDALPAVALDHTLGLSHSGFAFTPRALAVEAKAAVPLLRGDDGLPIALWRADGQGRVGLWWLADSWRLALGGERSRYATLWSDTLATLARARVAAAPQLPRDARVDERATICSIAADAYVATPSDRHVALLLGPGAVEPTCAAYWPDQPGWHVLVLAAQRWPFYVRARGEAQPLALAETAHATRALVGAVSVRAESSTRPIPLPRLPFFLAWLAIVTLLWLFERRALHA